MVFLPDPGLWGLFTMKGVLQYGEEYKIAQLWYHGNTYVFNMFVLLVEKSINGAHMRDISKVEQAAVVHGCKAV